MWNLDLGLEDFLAVVGWDLVVKRDMTLLLWKKAFAVVGYHYRDYWRDRFSNQTTNSELNKQVITNSQLSKIIIKMVIAIIAKSLQILPHCHQLTHWAPVLEKKHGPNIYNVLIAHQNPSYGSALNIVQPVKIWAASLKLCHQIWEDAAFLYFSPSFSELVRRTLCFTICTSKKFQKPLI